MLARPRSNGRFAVAFALILVPLLSAKAGAVFDQNLLGFMGVSYITFKALQVLFEVRDGVIEELGLFDYLYFLLFFPVFTSGPIDRSRRFAEDARKVRSARRVRGPLARGILLLLVGLVYTFVIAVWLHRFYAPTAWGTGPFLAELGVQVRTAYVYGLYLFFDFAGYSLMAMGASYSFRNPARAQLPRAVRGRGYQGLLEPVEHHAVVLAARLRVHAVLALGAEAPLVRQPAGRRMLGLRVRHGPYGRSRHGLTVNYLLYGLFHGLLLAGTEAFQKKSKFYKSHRKAPAFKALSWFVTLQLVMFGFALFSGQIAMLVKGAFNG